MRPTRTTLLLVPLLAMSAVAIADPPNADPCQRKHSGDACTAEDFDGVCVRRRCTRETDRGEHSFRCLVCESRQAHHHGHHRHHHDADEADEAGDAGVDADAGDATDVADASDVRDVVTTPPPRVRPAPSAPPRDGLLSCAATPARRGGSATMPWWLMACALAARGPRRRGPVFRRALVGSPRSPR